MVAMATTSAAAGYECTDIVLVASGSGQCVGADGTPAGSGDPNFYTPEHGCGADLLVVTGPSGPQCEGGNGAHGACHDETDGTFGDLKCDSYCAAGSDGSSTGTGGPCNGQDGANGCHGNVLLIFSAPPGQGAHCEGGNGGDAYPGGVGGNGGHGCVGVIVVATSTGSCQGGDGGDGGGDGGTGCWGTVVVALEPGSCQGGDAGGGGGDDGQACDPEVLGVGRDCGGIDVGDHEGVMDPGYTHA